MDTLKRWGGELDLIVEEKEEKQLKQEEEISGLRARLDDERSSISSMETKLNIQMEEIEKLKSQMSHQKERIVHELRLDSDDRRLRRVAGGGGSGGSGGHYHGGFSDSNIHRGREREGHSRQAFHGGFAL